MLYKSTLYLLSYLKMKNKFMNSYNISSILRLSLCTVSHAVKHEWLFDLKRTTEILLLNHLLTNEARICTDSLTCC